MKRKKIEKINERYREATKHVVICTDDSPKAIAKYKTYYAAPRFPREGKK